MSPQKDPLAIQVKGLTVSYEKKIALKNIHLDIQPEYIYGVVGPNGAGKSTLFKAILGLIEPDAGTILVEGKPINEKKKEVAYIPQKNDIDWDFPATVFDIVLMGRYPHKRLFQRLNKYDSQLTLEALEAVGISHLKNRQIGELSGGQQQRTFIARALCQDAKIMLLDEPFVGVDITTEEKIVEIMHKLASEGKTLLVVHHDLSTVSEYFHKTILLNQRLVAFGNTEEVFTQSNISRAYGGQLTILQKTGLLQKPKQGKKAL
jgi:ABC-type Mn2+/Zn2+ transport system ATPase subunit